MFLATVIFLFIEFDVLTHFQNICMIIHECKMGFPCSIIAYMRMGIYGTNLGKSFLTFLCKSAQFHKLQITVVRKLPG